MLFFFKMLFNPYFDFIGEFADGGFLFRCKVFETFEDGVEKSFFTAEIFEVDGFEIFGCLCLRNFCQGFFLQFFQLFFHEMRLFLQN